LKKEEGKRRELSVLKVIKKGSKEERKDDSA